MQENQNYEKHACQNTAAMETSNCLGQDMSYQNDKYRSFPSLILLFTTYFRQMNKTRKMWGDQLIS